MSCRLRLIEDQLAPHEGGADSFPALERVLYVVEGGITVEVHGGDVGIAAGSAWHGAAPCRRRGGPGGARCLRFELVRGAAPGLAGGRLVLEHAIDLVETDAYLIRCDRVDFEPGGVALPHRHRGGGIRCLLEGRIEVTVGDDPPRTFTPGGAWFESGREPVLARAAEDVATAFVRVAILPAEIKGRTSILYVNPEDAGRGAPRKYTVLVDDLIAP